MFAAAWGVRFCGPLVPDSVVEAGADHIIGNP